jgi:hypothetical protein
MLALFLEKQSTTTLTNIHHGKRIWYLPEKYRLHQKIPEKMQEKSGIVSGTRFYQKSTRKIWTPNNNNKSQKKNCHPCIPHYLHHPKNTYI